MFGAILQALNGNSPEDIHLKKKIEYLLPHFRIEDGKVLYEGQLCVPRYPRIRSLEIAHDSKDGGHFCFTKTLARLE